MTSALAPQSDGFLPRFVGLAILAGTTIGMGNVITTLFALHLGAGALEVGLISGAATLGMIAVSLPAGFLIARFGARRVYLLASLNCVWIYGLVPFLTFWPALAAARALVGASVPFRTISMNASFLQRMPQLGAGKAGWYRASQNIGLAVLGPWVGTALTGHSSFLTAYLCLALMFLAMALWSQNFLPEAEDTAAPVSGDDARGVIGQLKAMASDPWVGESCLTELVSSSVVALFSSFILVLAVRELGWAVGEGVLLVTMQGVTTIIALFALGPLLPRIGIARAYALSILLGSAGLMLVGLGGQLAVLMVGSVCLAGSAALVHLVNMSRLAGSAFPKAKISSLLNLAGQIGSLAGAVLGGLLSVIIGLHLVFIAWLPVIWVTASILFWRHRRLNRRSLV